MDTGEKIKEFDRLFSLEERWSGQLEEYYMSLYSRYQEKIKERSGKMSLEQLEEWMKEDIKRKGGYAVCPAGKVSGRGSI